MYINIYIYIHIYIYSYIYIHITHIHICIYTFLANGDSTTVYNNIPMYIVINFQPRGICNIAPFGSRPRTAGSQQNKSNAEARLRLNTEPIINTGSTLTVHRERLIHIYTYIYNYISIYIYHKQENNHHGSSLISIKVFQLNSQAGALDARVSRFLDW